MPGIFSKDLRYRYVLTRDLKNLLGHGTLLFIGLNPSTADDTVDDPTIRRLKKFTVRLGFQKLVIGNLFAYRSTDPKIMFEQEDPIGPDNDFYLKKQIELCNIVLCAWGNGGRFKNRDRHVLKMIGAKSYCLKTNSGGTPAHPLYLPSNLKLTPYQFKIKEN